MNTVESLRIQAEALSESSLIGMKLVGAADEIEELVSCLEEVKKIAEYRPIDKLILEKVNATLSSLKYD